MCFVNSSNVLVKASVGEIGLIGWILHFLSLPLADATITVFSFMILMTLLSATYLG